MTASTISKITRNGRMPRIASPIGATAIDDSTNRFRPTGGWMSPISMLWVKMIEKCTGSTAIGASAGARIGSTRRSVAVPAARLRKKPDQPDHIADQHQEAADRLGRIIEPHRKPQIRRTALVDQQRDVDDLAAVPDQGAAKQDGRDAIKYFHPSCHAGRDHVEHEIGPDMAVGADQLAGHDHD